MGSNIDIDAQIVRDKVRAIFAGNIRATTVWVAQQLRIPEYQVVRYLPDGRSTELDAARIPELIRACETLGVVHAIEQNGGVVLEAHGQFGGFSENGPCLEVHSDTLDLRIEPGDYAAAFAVVVPSRTGIVEQVSFQFFSADGHASFKICVPVSGMGLSPDDYEQFQRLRVRYALSAQ